MPKKPVKKPERKSTKRRAKIESRKNYLAYAIVILFVVGISLGFGYYFGQQDAKLELASCKKLSPSAIFEDIEPKKSQIMISDKAGFGLEGMIEKLRKHKKEEDEKKARAKAQKNAITKTTSKRKPRLVFIIDDISQRRQLRDIKALPFKVTPSIFPPSSFARNSNKLAVGLKHFMIHLPMQSARADMNKMTSTLMISDSAAKIKKRAKQIRKLFPNGRYINNHTGSVFTSNYKKMKLLYRNLRDEGFVFVDSRTSGSSKIKRIAREYDDRYMVRDVFIDNTQTKKYTLKQIAKAVKIAKKRGYAIAIGHPHRTTMQALHAAKDIFTGVDVVYIDELYK